MQIAFILDIIIAVLLVLTITYAVRLNQRLGQLRGDKNELMELAKTFAEATTKAEAGIQQLKISSDALRDEVKKAEALRDDLTYLIDRGGRSADEMVASVRSPKRTNDDDMVGDDETRLIEEAIRAATPEAGGRRKKASGLKRLGGQDDIGVTTRRITGHPEPARDVAREPEHAPRPLGGGLGGLNPEDRLLDDPFHKSDEEPKTVGDTDAARELLKALSAVK